MKKGVLPIRCQCRNCGASLVGRYCHVCGQDVFAGTSRRVRDVVANSLDVVFAWDNKFWHSIVALVAFPGRLTREYLDGRIVRYIHPSKLFWFLSIVFFAILLSGTEDLDRRIGEAVKAPPADSLARAEALARADSLAQAAVPEVADGFEVRFDTDLLGQDGREALSNLELFSALKSAAPYLMLVMMPFFALLVWLFFWRKYYYYADYLIFALHYHAFLFLLFSLWMVVRMIFPALVENNAGVAWVVAAVPALYLLLSLRRVFGARIVPSVFKIAAMAIMYAIFMSTVLITSLIFWVGVIKGLH